MKRYIAISAIALAAAVTAGAQNLNPTVEVTNQFEGKVMEVAKPVVDMDVPDSLLRFDLDFDYSVFDTPYKGAYEFSPYLLDIRPEAEATGGRKLYLKAGAGYSLHPTLDLVFTPELNIPLQLNVYAQHRSYFGDYKVRLGDWSRDFKGYDAKTRAGVDGRFDFKDGALTFDVGYYGIHTKEGDATMPGKEFSDDETAGFNALDLKARVRSINDASEYFLYDAALSFRAGKQASNLRDKLNVNDFVFDGTFGPVLSDKIRILMDVHVGINAYSGLFSTHTGTAWLAPKYVWTYDRWRISAGARLATTLHSSNEWMGFALGTRKSQRIYPDARVGYEALADRLNLYAELTGGDHVWSYSEMKEDNHFFSPVNGRGLVALSDNSVEHFRLLAGVQGNIAAKFRYDLSAGYAIISNGLLDAVVPVWDLGMGDSAREINRPFDGTRDYLLPSMAYANYSLLFVKGSFAYDAKPVSVRGGFNYVSPKLKDFTVGFPPSKSAELAVRYNWHDRISFAVSAEGVDKRSGKVANIADPVVIPGFVNLGLQGEFALTRKLSVWAQAGNLLNQNIQRHPLYPESGIHFTGGLILNL